MHPKVLARVLIEAQVTKFDIVASVFDRKSEPIADSVGRLTSLFKKFNDACGNVTHGHFENDVLEETSKGVAH